MSNEVAANLVLWRPSHGHKGPGRPSLDFATLLMQETGLDIDELQSAMSDSNRKALFSFDTASHQTHTPYKNILNSLMSSNSNSESCSPPRKRPRTCATQNGLPGQFKNGVSLPVQPMMQYKGLNLSLY
eukprot:gene850-10598_t